MDRMWAPWRMTYILSAAGEQGPQECIFCRFPAQGPEHYAENLVLCSTPQAFVVMNRYPYNSGHIMVVPRAHGGDLMALPAADYAATCELLRKSLHIVTTELRAHGANVGLNQGRVAGAGIDQHAHFHIVPRWNGDTNFMPVVADVRVISEHLTATYEKLRPAFAPLQQADPPG
ncbi:MAG TPA: HIT domain-containing protein [Pseudomonadota bacterium]|nr:HIT domain-containing protein [Pseudomonadota bacterium]